MKQQQVTILGAGPAGLSSAHHLISRGTLPMVLEQAPAVGGISRTLQYGGYRFDLGGHRFFTRLPEIAQLWQDLMGDDFLTVSRQSRILYQGRFMNYPLHLPNVVASLGPGESFLCLLSYLHSRVQPKGDPETLEGWISNRFGKRLFQKFFESYSEKVWGRSCREIRSHWSAQRIRTLSFHKALFDALFQTEGSKSLVREFHYPVKGAGMMWERLKDRVIEGKGHLHLSSKALRLEWTDNRVCGLVFERDGESFHVSPDHLISSIPLVDLLRILDPPAPKQVFEAVDALSFRAFIMVLLVLDKEDLFSDQWIYVHDPDVRVGRIQNFKQWSPFMVPDLNRTSVGMEYFCDPGDDFFNMEDQDLKILATRELVQLGFIAERDVLDGTVARVAKAYPIYDMDYDRHLGIIRSFLNTIDNLQTIGRNGMHAYNNMDLAMHSGILAAKNVLGESHDLWGLIEQEKYLE